jgi:hypothetical protein
MNRVSFSVPRLSALWISLLTLILAQLGTQALATTGFDHDANGNLTAVRAAVAGSPVIETQPQSRIVGAGSGAGLSVVVSSSSPASFQWKREDGSNVAGAIGDSLYFPEVTPSMEGRYYVIVTNASGSVTSAMAFLYVDSNWNSLPDTWEMTYFRNLSQTATGDFDGDGISNLDEYNQGLNPAVREIVYWIAASGDLGNAANWSRGRLPIEGDTAVINSGTFTISSGTSLRASQVTVNVPYTAPASHVTLRITGKWNFNGPFTLTSGWRFTVDGDAPGAEVAVSGTTALNAGSLTVSGGAKLTFANLQTFVHPADVDIYWLAQQANSEIIFSNLVTITGPSTAGEHLSIQALSGGAISFPLLTSITKPQDSNASPDSGVVLQARSSGRLSAPVLAAFNDNDSNPDSEFLADGGGVLQAPQLLAVKGASINLNEASNPQRFTSLVNARSIEFNSGSGALTTSNLTTITGNATLTVTGGANVAFGSLTSVDNLTRIQVDSGAKARFSSVTSYAHPTSLNLDVYWVAQDVNSELIFTSLATITGPSTAGEYLSIQALSGGAISFPLLTSITKPQDSPNNAVADSGVVLQARSSGRLSAPVLAAFNDNDSNPDSEFLADGGGVLQAPQLLAVKGASINLNEASNPQRFTSLVNARSIEFNSGSGALTTSNLTTITGNATLTVTGGANVAFGSLTSVDNLTRIQVDSGAKARFNSVAGYAHPTSLNLDVYWVAQDVNSELIFSNLATITGPSTAGEYLYIQAFSGGAISFPLLTSITKPQDNSLTITDSGVAINASSGAISAPVLASFRDNDSRPNSSITRGTTGVLALPNLASTGILGVALSGTTLPATAAPLINTPSATAITDSGASLGGNVLSDGGSAITERGVVYALSSTNNNPVIGGAGVTKVTAAGTTGAFTSPVTGLPLATSHSFKAYAINSLGTSYTSVGTFTTLSTNANLSNMNLSSGTLSPGFASGTTSYTAGVSNALSSITVTPTRAQANATIEARVNGGAYAAVSSGSPSAALPLNVGANTVDVRVTAQDGVTQRTYSITVTRLLVPIVTSPTSTTINATSAILGGNVTSDSGAAITERGIVISATTANSDPFIGGTGVTKISMTGATGVFTIQVIQMTPGTGYSYRAYAINGGGVGYSPASTFATLSTNADLSNLVLSSGSFSPVFASGTTSYIANVANAVSSISVTPTRAQANATIEARVNTGTYAAVTSGSPSGALALNIGSNSVDVRVTAQDGVTQNTYTITVMRLAAPALSSPTATSITASGATLSGNLTSDGGANITERGVVFSVTATNANPLIGGSGVTKVESTSSTSIFTVPVTNLVMDTSYSFKAYAVNSQGTSYTSLASFTTRSANADLSALSLSDGTLSPAFANGTIAYTVSVSNATDSITITPTRAQANAMIEARLNGGIYAALTSGSPSAALPLNEASNTVDVRVTAQAGNTKTYTVTVNRAENLTVAAAHSAPSSAYQPGGTIVLNASFSYPVGRNLQSLLWRPQLPAGWSMVSVSGDGTPELAGGEIVFLAGSIPQNPVQISAVLSVPGGSSGQQSLSSAFEYQLGNMINPQLVTAVPNPLLLSQQTYHDADYRLPRWAVDGTEMNRVLSYWRAGSYFSSTETPDGFAAGAGGRGRDHLADYLSPKGALSGTEMNRVLSYWRAGAYHANSLGPDGFAPGVQTVGLAMMASEAEVGVASESFAATQTVPSGYVPGQALTVSVSMNYTGTLWSLLVRPEIPAGWTLQNVSGTGSVEYNFGEAVWVGSIPASPVQLTYQLVPPAGASAAVQIRNQVEYQLAGQINPASIQAAPDPATISPGTNADLSGLTLSSGTLSPAFASGTTAYTASVSNGTTSITVTPTRAQANATIEVRVNTGTYAAVTSGSPSAALALNLGSNTVDVRVTAQDGTTQKTYTVTVTRMAAPTVTSPTATNITATGATLGGNVTSDGGAAITERGVVYSATATNSNPLIGGTGVTKVTATGATGVFSTPIIGLTPLSGYSYKAYAINSQGTSYTSVMAFTSSSINADLSGLTLSSGTLSPAFASGTTAYTASVSNGTTSITVTPTRAQANATIEARVNTGTYAAVTSGSPSAVLALNLGSNTVDVRVTAQDGTTQKTYTVTVTRMAAPTVTSPTATNITATGATLGGNVTSDGGAAITERGVVYSAAATNSNPLIGGTGVTKVTATGGTGVFSTPIIGLTPLAGYSYKAYAINSQGTSYTSVMTFTTLSANPDLSNLTLSIGTLSPVFASATTAYSASVSNGTTSITVTPTRAQANATIEARVNTGTYAAVTSGSPSAVLALNLGSNTVDVRVTAQDGTTQKTYTVTVTRMAAPTVTSPTATNITATGATLGGNVTSDGGAAITERGVVYSATATNADPLIGGEGVTRVIVIGTNGVFDSAISGLTNGTTYSFRAYATNSLGTGYSTLGTFVADKTSLLLSFQNNATGSAGEIPSTNSGLNYAVGVSGQAALLGNPNQLFYPRIDNIDPRQGTLEFWIKPEWAGNDGQEHMILKMGSGGGMLFGKDGANNWRCIFNRFSPDGQPEFGVSVNISNWKAGEWHHAAFTWGGGELRLYLDGALQANAAAPDLPDIDASNTIFQIGGDGSGSYINAMIDELRLSSMPLTDQEIQQNYFGDLQEAPFFIIQPYSTLVPLGSEAVLEANVAGEIPMNFNWYKGTTLYKWSRIHSINSSICRIYNSKASDAAQYWLSATNQFGLQISQFAYLGIVSPLDETRVIKAGGSLSLACTAVAPKLPGVTLSYAWKRGGVPLANGIQSSEAVIAGADKATLAITRITAGESGSYSCEVTMTTPGNDPVLSAGQAIVQVVDAVPVVDAIPLPERISVSQPVDVFITATNSPTTFSVSGLPAGLKLDAKTGRLTGRPTSPSKKDSLGADLPFKLSFKAANPSGTSAARHWNLVIEPLDSQAVGTFHGIVTREGQSNFNMGGQVQLTVASTGAVSGSATLAGQKHSIMGALDASLDEDPSAVLQIKRSPATLCDLLLQINLSTAESKLTGSVTDPRFVMRPGSLELGNPAEQGLVNGSMDEARFSGPRGVVLNSTGKGYIADTGNHVIRLVDAANGEVSTLAGTGSPGSSDGTGTGAAFSSPEGLALDSSGNLYVADSGNATIRRITPAGVVTTFAGSAGQVGAANGTGAAARFNQPCALCLDPMGNLYVVDRGNHTIRKITPSGVVTTLAGKADTAGHKDGSGTSVLFNSPRGIAYDPLLKALFVADTNNCVIRRVTLTGATTTYAGSPGVPGAHEGLLGNARFLAPASILSLGDGTLVVADTLLVQLNSNGTSGVISDYVDAVDRNDHPVALALNPEDRTLIVAHDTLHALAGHGATGQSPPGADLVAWRNVWSSTNLVPAANQGLYNAVLRTTAPADDLATPHGHGYTQVSISKSGAANWAGKAADGSTLTFSTVLAEDDSIPLHVMLYGNTGSLQGVAKIDFQTGEINEHTNHVLDWWKVPQPMVSKDRSYKAGFMTTLEFRGGRYTPNDLHGFLGLSGSPAAMALSFAQSPTETFEQPFTIMDPNGVTVPSNTKRLSLKIDPKTGMFSGSYKEGSPTLTMNYAGILFNHQASGERKGLGHFLKPESSATNSTIGSAPVSLDEVGPQ